MYLKIATHNSHNKKARLSLTNPRDASASVARFLYENVLCCAASVL